MSGLLFIIRRMVKSGENWLTLHLYYAGLIA